MTLNEWLFENGSAILSATSGAVVYVTMSKPKNIWEGFLLLLAGSLTSFWATPPIMHYFKLDNEYAGGVGFMLGVFAMLLLQILFARLPSIVNKVIDSKIDKVT